MDFYPKIYLLLLLLLFSANTYSSDQLNNNYYGNLTKDQKQLLMLNEQHHLYKAIKNAKTGKMHRLTYAKADYHYILARWPNHPKALIGMTRVLLKLKAKPEIDLMYQNAIELFPMVPETYVLYGIYLYKEGEYNKAESNFLKATQLRKDYAEGYYNLALSYLAQDKKELAVKNAHKAYDLGFPLPGLRNKLQKLNLW